MSSAPRRTAVFLSPGEYVVGDARHLVRTLLGSCVSITLWQAQRRVGAMSHFLLAERHPGRADAASHDLDARYGADALALMLRGLAAFGVAPGECEAKLFGGGDMFPGQTRSEPLHVGRRNGDAARALVEAHGIPVASHSLFGNGYRRIVFDMASGTVWSRLHGPDAAPGTQPLPLAADGCDPLAPLR